MLVLLGLALFQLNEPRVRKLSFDQLHAISGLQYGQANHECVVNPNSYCLCNYTTSTPGIVCAANCGPQPDNTPALRCSEDSHGKMCSPKTGVTCTGTTAGCGSRESGDCVNGIFDPNEGSSGPCNNIAVCS
jgi:hypothetical protein